MIRLLIRYKDANFTDPFLTVIDEHNKPLEFKTKAGAKQFFIDEYSVSKVWNYQVKEYKLNLFNEWKEVR